MRLSDFNRYAGDFEKKKKGLVFLDEALGNIRRQGSFDIQALNKQGFDDREADIRDLNARQQMITSSTSSTGLPYGGLGGLLPLSSRGIFKGLDDD